MIEIYEKETDKLEMIDGKEETIKEITVCDKKDATYKHICGHDQDPPQPCRRVKL